MSLLINRLFLCYLPMLNQNYLSFHCKLKHQSLVHKKIKHNFVE